MDSECRALNLLRQTGPPALLVSLPANDPELARAAADAGAQGLKVHINIQHAAAGVRFGSLDEESANIARVVDLGLPVGVVPGDQHRMISPEDFCRLPHLGLDFVDVYLQAMPAWMLVRPPLSVMVAAGCDDMMRPQRLSAIGAFSAVQMLEASIIPHDGYAAPLSVADLADYTALVGHLPPDLPVMVPTQRRILPADLPALAATGIRGLLIGAIVTGTDAASIAAATAQYRRALDELV